MKGKSEENHYKSHIWKTNHDCYFQKENLKAHDIEQSRNQSWALHNVRTKEFSTEENTQKSKFKMDKTVSPNYVIKTHFHQKVSEKKNFCWFQGRNGCSGICQ